MRSLATRLAVLEARAAAEVVFHAEASAADWAESAVQNPKRSDPRSPSSIPPHWEAGIRYACTVSLAFLVAAAEEADDPARFEAFTQQCVADVASTTCQQKLRPYDLVPAREMPETLARFQRLVHAAAAKDLAQLRLEAWKRHSDRLVELRRASQKRPRDTTAANSGCTLPGRSRQTSAPSAAELALEREPRLQAFRLEHDVSIVAVCRTAKVDKADMQRWRHGKLSQHSLMSQRVENVLSGITPLAQLSQ